MDVEPQETPAIDVEDMLKLAREIREHLMEPLTHESINEMLYGPDGLPG